MEIYRIPRRELSVRILLDDGRSLDGRLFTADSGPGGRPDDPLRYLNDPEVEFIPLTIDGQSFLLNKAGVIWAQLTGDAAREVADTTAGGKLMPVRLTLAGGMSLVGTLAIVMPPERSRVLDYLNAAGRFLPLFGEGTVTLVQRRFIVVVRSADEVPAL